MSIVESLKRLFDPATYNYEKAEKKAERALRKVAKDGDPPDFEIPTAAAGDAKRATHYRCKLCNYTAANGAYCLDCLAETMQPAEPPMGQ